MPFFICSKDETLCDNVLPTTYDGHNPPCCTHILRDMAHIFDKAMDELGLDYVTGFGTLLGLVRGDRFIPWTGDNDFILPSAAVANAMVDLWDVKATGMAHVHQGMNRMCITSDFVEGQLARSYWSNKTLFGTMIIQTKQSYGRLWDRGHPYIDFYVGSNVSESMFQEIKPCQHVHSDVFPTKKMLVYNGTLRINFPANPHQLLRTYYGKDWLIPYANKNPHGFNEPLGICPFGPNE